jgi:hypothetical protein
MFKLPTTVMDRFLVLTKAVGVEESRTVTVTVFVAVAVGVPLMTPVVALKVSPAGRPVTDQVYGATPPAAVSVTP